MRIKYARKLSFFCIDVQQTFSFPLPLLKRYQMPEYFYVKKHCFRARATASSYYRNWYDVGNAVVVSACADQS